MCVCVWVCGCVNVWVGGGLLDRYGENHSLCVFVYLLYTLPYIWLLQLPAGKGGVYGPVKTMELTCASPALIDHVLTSDRQYVLVARTLVKALQAPLKL